MEESKPQDFGRDGNTPAGKKKRAYQKPAFRHERVFETQALSCGKVFSSQSQCKFNRKTS